MAIGEVELVARGYRLSGQDPATLGTSPIVRMEQSASMKHCLPLRMELLGALERSFESLSPPQGRSSLVTHGTDGEDILQGGGFIGSYHRPEVVGEGEGEEPSLSIRHLQEQLYLLYSHRRLCLAECLHRLEELEGTPLTVGGWVRSYDYAYRLARWFSYMSSVAEAGSKRVEDGYSREFLDRFRFQNESSPRHDPKGEAASWDEGTEDPMGKGTDLQRQWLRHVRNLERQVSLIHTKLYLEGSGGPHKGIKDPSKEAEGEDVERTQWVKETMGRWESVHQALGDAKTAWAQGQFWLQNEALGSTVGEAGSGLDLDIQEGSEGTLELAGSTDGKQETSTLFDSETTPHHWNVPGEVFEATADPEEFFRPASVSAATFLGHGEDVLGRNKEEKVLLNVISSPPACLGPVSSYSLENTSSGEDQAGAKAPRCTGKRG